MRRPITILTMVLVAVIASLVVTTHDATASTTVQTTSGLPAGWLLDTTPCPTTAVSASVEGPGATPLGNGSLRVVTTADAGTPYGFAPVNAPFNAPMDEVTTLQTGYLNADVGSSMWAVLSDPGSADSVQLIAQGSASATWSTIDMLTAPSLLIRTNGTVGGSTTWSDYASAHPQASIVIAALTTSCAAATTAYYDNVLLGTASSQTQYDLDVQVGATVTSAASPAIINFGATATVTGKVTRRSDSNPLAGVDVELWAKPYGAAVATKLATATSAANGTLSQAVKPTKFTAYEWRLPSGVYAPYSSAIRNVSVRVVPSIHVLASKVKYPALVVVWGAVKPAPTGTKVTLHRTSSSPALATATVASDGTWAIGRALSRGSYTLYISVPATPGVLAGSSPKVGVTVQ